jgi:DNA mismatch repair protein MutS
MMRIGNAGKRTEAALPVQVRCLAMTFHSILFEGTADGRAKETPEAPECFVDLNLDQVINAITAGRQEYHLKPFFYTPLKDIATIQYRQEIAQDLENETLLDNTFAIMWR